MYNSRLTTAGFRAGSATTAAAAALLSLGAFVVPAHSRPETATRTGTVTVFGHRGAPTRAPENTLASVRKASALGTKWVENDVQRTKDGKLVVIHDTTLTRTTNAKKIFPNRAPWNVGDFTLAEIKKLDAGSWFGKEYRNERVPTLGQYMDLLNRTGQKLLLELKQPQLYPGIEQQALGVLRAKGWLDSGHVRDKLVIQSFSAAALRTTHRLSPAVRTGLLGSPAPGTLKAYAAFADEVNPRYTAATPSYIDAVHRLKGPHGIRLKVNAWTVDDTSTAARMVGFGVDGIITNRPQTICEAVG
ncbi:MAG: glycerophosphoryl diester phosphodiesterase [Streptomycetaceae bacterium]|jgi:glycerophosphoryl diester phosphodiesterase|nr:glycerophosphoryl diester phosphodiesterase [Streptomycetaceae bacterium]